ncbi:signal peptidase I [Priestia megaterium]|uniref:signal peptidase I n=1 Tax=Priestia megaterium TaxID=1404 RepID=UPI002E247CB7|nr:signal peptidase I [Priestia megaterium]MED4285516.1 signal peptidase I [Priestia megaterium]
MEIENSRVARRKQNQASSKEWIFSFAFAIIVVFLLRTFVVGLAIVDGPSMLNTIQDGDRIVYSKLSKPDKGDIVVVVTPDGTKIIKRVIGLEGDTVEIKNGILYVNGKEKKEDYIMEPMFDYDYEKITVPKGKIFVMGDNRNISADSRKYGTFDLKEHYEGKVVLEFWNSFKLY